MNSWPDTRILNLTGIQLPIIQAPMAGATSSEMAIAISNAGGLGSLPCAMLSANQFRTEMSTIRRHCPRPINANFFCHDAPHSDRNGEVLWRQRLAPYYAEFGLDPQTSTPDYSLGPFDSAKCELVEEFRPEVVSFHFGLPPRDLLARVQATGAKIFSTATTIDEALWLEREGCDAIIAQGYEAGGHRGMFRTTDISTQAGTMALVPQMVDVVKVPVIAAGGIMDGRGIAAAFALGAAAVQMGTAFLLCPEATVSPIHRSALRNATDSWTALTNVFTGRPARAIVNRLVREVGPMSDLAPPFPYAASALAPLRAKAELLGSQNYTALWSGQAARLAREIPAAELTLQLAAETLNKLKALQL